MKITLDKSAAKSIDIGKLKTHICKGKKLHCIDDRTNENGSIELVFEPLPEFGENGKTHNMKR